MKISWWQVSLAALLIISSAILYYLHYSFFHDTGYIFSYFSLEIAFLPIQVLLVTLILNELMSFREKRSRLEKMNMVIGAFFSEIGSRLLVVLSDADSRLERIKKSLIITTDWQENTFASANQLVCGHDCSINMAKVDLAMLHELLVQKREFLLRLLENPNLLEHEAFTDLLWAVFHLEEELSTRKKLVDLIETDSAHLGGDLKRVYSLLIKEWVNYMKHLKANYPYLFSLALRTNPFDESATPEVK